MTGVFIAIVGPSGAGKDSLLRALAVRLAGDASVIVARRVVTRPSDAHEDHVTLDPAAFRDAERAGHFALTWTAHGLRYGVPVAVDLAIADGKIVLCNLSRAAVAAARTRFERSFVVLVTASPETLAARLAARGREGSQDRRDRLECASAPNLAIPPDFTIENDGPLEAAAARLHEIVANCRAVAIP